jgi:sulfur carrier protein
MASPYMGTRPIREAKADMPVSLTVTINGESRQFDAGISIADMIAQFGLDPKKVAVERNLTIVPRSTLGEVQVADGDKYEIVHFVGGG